MSGIEKISKTKIDKSLDENVRQYLVGNLAFPQQLQHIQDENIEVGISHYKSFTADIPHVHTEVTEYQMILAGVSIIKDLMTGNLIELQEGDFYVVHKNTPYAQKSSAGTKILFFKHPGMNDKVPVEINALCEEWLKEKI